MKTFEFNNRKVTILTDRVVNLITKDNQFDISQGDYLYSLYEINEAYPVSDELTRDVKIDYKHENGVTTTYYSLDFTGFPFGSKGINYGKLCDVIGVSNKTSYWME